MKKIYKFHWNCGRDGDLYGIFVSEEKKIINLINKELYFGSVLGKHSEIGGSFEEKEIEIVSDDPNIIKIFEDNDMKCGYNPLDYINEK